METDIYFCNLTASPGQVRKISSRDNVKVNLEIFRGLNENIFYFAFNNEGNENDALKRIKIDMLNRDMPFKIEHITYPGTGAILALELDPFHTNDIKTYREYDRDKRKS